jgi:hypothetical protein
MKILLTVPQIAFIITLVLVVIAIILFIVLVPLRRRKNKNNFRKHYYKTIYKIAFDEDYYLINDFLLRVDNNNVAKIDHILFGNKYIYLINDYYYEGDLTGKDSDESLILINENGKKFYTDNPNKLADKIANKISRRHMIDKSLLIGITLVNDSCRISVESNNKSFYIIQRNKVSKLIKAIESRPVAKLVPSQLEATVQLFNKAKIERKKS